MRPNSELNTIFNTSGRKTNPSSGRFAMARLRIPRLTVVLQGKTECRHRLRSVTTRVRLHCFETHVSTASNYTFMYIIGNPGTNVRFYRQLIGNRSGVKPDAKPTYADPWRAVRVRVSETEWLAAEHEHQASRSNSADAAV